MCGSQRTLLHCGRGTSWPTMRQYKRLHWLLCRYLLEEESRQISSETSLNSEMFTHSNANTLNIFGPGTDPISLVILFFFLLLLGRLFKKALRLRRFKSDRVKIWRECSWSKYTPIDEVGFQMWCHTFKMAVMTLFHAWKCCHLVSENEAPAMHICSSVHQFLIYGTFVAVCWQCEWMQQSNETFNYLNYSRTPATVGSTKLRWRHFLIHTGYLTSTMCNKKATL